MEKGEPLAELEAGGGAICQGKASAEPIPQSSAVATSPNRPWPVHQGRVGHGWTVGETALHYSYPKEKQSPGRANSGCSSTLQLGPWTCLSLHASDLTLLTHKPRSKSREQTGSPLPRLFRSTAFLSLPPVSKTQPPNPESYFPTLRKEGMPTHRKASVAQSHPGRKPRWEAAGHLLVKEETISWAPWTRPTLGCISHLHTTNLAATV